MSPTAPMEVLQQVFNIWQADEHSRRLFLQGQVFVAYLVLQEKKGRALDFSFIGFISK